MSHSVSPFFTTYFRGALSATSTTGGGKPGSALGGGGSNEGEGAGAGSLAQAISRQAPAIEDSKGLYFVIRVPTPNIAADRTSDIEER